MCGNPLSYTVFVYKSFCQCVILMDYSYFAYSFKERKLFGISLCSVVKVKFGSLRRYCNIVQLIWAQFRCWTFHEPNLLPWIKYMKSSASESVKNGYLNLELLQPGILPLEWLWFRRRTFRVLNLCVSYNNLAWNPLTFWFVLVQTELSLAN